MGGKKPVWRHGRSERSAISASQMVIYFVGHVVQKVQARKVYTPVRSCRALQQHQQEQLPETAVATF